ncbi:M13 family metallopeptidase [Lactobacillus sp. ESL0684]|uniref:M13 family metallopeptidase n=1 Tax=Lactobacillus sp. ESL0684 TaxID=2983213 RepID=UPI0023F7F5D4|nr:M13 family metallopeptidase [Lactobacillus sp. ESL0684]WEV43802.1 M13 family metallopeptidase [Lactobacillus sp. ESL0684]
MKRKFKLIIAIIVAIITLSPLNTATDTNNNQSVVLAATKAKKQTHKSTTKLRRNSRIYNAKGKATKHKLKKHTKVSVDQARYIGSKLYYRLAGSKYSGKNLWIKQSNTGKVTGPKVKVVNQQPKKTSKATIGGSGNLLQPKVGTRPQDNLYLAVNSTWMQQAKIPADEFRTSSFDDINSKVNQQLSQDMADFANGKKAVPNIPDLNKAVELYKIARDTDKRNHDGAKPIKADLAQLENIKDFDDLNAKAADLDNTIIDFPIGFYASPDMKHAQTNALYFSEIGTMLPDASNYSKSEFKKLKSLLKQKAIKLLTMAGVDKTQATTYVADALKFDQLIAKNTGSAEESADLTSNYHPMNLQDFKAKFTDFDIQKFLQGTVGQEPKRILITDPSFLDNVNKVINRKNFDGLKSWLIVNFINDAVEDLSQEFQEACLPYAQAINGTTKLASADKQAFATADSAFDEVIGIYYGKTYFGSAAKKDVTAMINQFLQTYEKRLQNNNWLSEATKQQAIAKLKAMVVKVGYPDKVSESYHHLKVTPASQGGTLYSNNRAIAIEENKENYAQLSKPVDRTEWSMTGDTVNAAYNVYSNDITFPAAILQAPFYDKNQSKAANLGGIGSVIGHEISHAFDNNGAQFDKYGNLDNWWTKQDYAEFQKRIQAEIKLFNGIKYGSGKVNGKQTVSENIADQGGLSTAIEVAKSENADLRELFESYARIWRIKTTPQEAKFLLAQDAHAPSPLRANVQVQCQDDFYKVFNVKPGDGMWLAPNKRVKIW